jgi:hypothetical protein
MHPSAAAATKCLLRVQQRPGHSTSCLCLLGSPLFNKPHAPKQRCSRCESHREPSKRPADATVSLHFACVNDSSGFPGLIYTRLSLHHLDLLTQHSPRPSLLALTYSTVLIITPTNPFPTAIARLFTFHLRILPAEAHAISTYLRSITLRSTKIASHSHVSLRRQQSRPAQVGPSGRRRLRKNKFTQRLHARILSCTSSLHPCIQAAFAYFVC